MLFWRPTCSINGKESCLVDTSDARGEAMTQHHKSHAQQQQR